MKFCLEKDKFILKVRFRQRFQAWKIGLKICLEKDKFYPGYREVFSVRMAFLGSNL